MNLSLFSKWGARYEEHICNMGLLWIWHTVKYAEVQCTSQPNTRTRHSIRVNVLSEVRSYPSWDDNACRPRCIIILQCWNRNIWVDGARPLTDISRLYQWKLFRRIYDMLVALEVVTTIKSALFVIWVTSDEAVESHWYTARTTSPQTFTRHWLCKETKNVIS